MFYDIDITFAVNFLILISSPSHVFRYYLIDFFPYVLDTFVLTRSSEPRLKGITFK